MWISMLESMLTFGSVGLVVVLISGLLFGLGIRLDRIKPIEERRWSWRKARDGFRDGLVVVLLMLVFMLVVTLIYQPGFYQLDKSPNPGSELKWPVTELASRLVIGLGIVTTGLIGQLLIQLIDLIVTLLVTVLIAGLIGGLIRGLTTHQIVTRTSPNEGIRRSLQNARIGLLTGLPFGSLFIILISPISGLIGMLDSVLGPDTTLFERVALVLSIGLLFGDLFALWNGGFAYLKHYVLRFLLWHNDYAPWSYIRLLDHAVERVFLRKVGGGYIFTHRLLMEYFATLQSTNQARQTQTA
jgi:hypothetical protein